MKASVRIFRRLERALYYQIAISLFLLLCLRAKGATDGRVNVCEFEDVNIFFPNTPADSRSDIKAKTWNRENGILLASWMASTNFVVSPLYGDRLIAVGENSIKIRNATRSDAGTYTLVLTSGSTQNFIEFMVDLEVLVSPSNQCVPSITREVDSLMVELPSEGCGIPSLTPRWINHSQNLIYGNINVLKLDSDVGQEIYIACAAGESIRCFQGDAKHLCANYSKNRTSNEIEPERVTKILIPLFVITFTLIAVIVSLVCYLKWKRNRSRFVALAGVHSTIEEHALITLNTTNKGLSDIKQYLINKYKTKKSKTLSKFDEDNCVDVSHIYADLEITSQLTEDVNGKGNTNRPAATLKDIFCIDKHDENTEESNPPIPAVILGQCGVGKSTWCKKLVQEWCTYHDNKEKNMNVEQVNKSEVAKFEILLFVPLQNKLQGSTFVDCLKSTLFYNATRHFKRTMKYLSEHRESVLVILDGLDAVTDNLEPIVNLLKDKDIFPCTIVLTSRQNGLKSLRAKERGALRLFQIHGMSLGKASEYAEQVFSLINRDDLTLDSYWNFIRDLQVQILCQVPFIGLCLILTFIERTNFPKNRTDILLTIIEYHLRRAMRRRWFRDNIVRVLKKNVFDVSKYIKKIKYKKLLRANGYLLKALSIVAEKIWSLQIQNNAHDEGIDIGNVTDLISEECVQLCTETGILIQTSENIMATNGTKIAFGHVIFFDFFVALSLALGKQDSSSRCNISLDPTEHGYIIQMLKDLTSNTGQEISNTGDHSAIETEMDTSKERT